MTPRCKKHVCKKCGVNWSEIKTKMKHGDFKAHTMCQYLFGVQPFGKKVKHKGTIFKANKTVFPKEWGVK